MEIPELTALYNFFCVPRDFVLVGPLDFSVLVATYLLANIVWTDWKLPYETAWFTAQITKLVLFAGHRFQHFTHDSGKATRLVNMQQVLMSKGAIYLTLITSVTAAARQWDYNDSTNWEYVHSIQFALFATSALTAALRLSVWLFIEDPKDAKTS